MSSDDAWCVSAAVAAAAAADVDVSLEREVVWVASVTKRTLAEGLRKHMLDDVARKKRRFPNVPPQGDGALCRCIQPTVIVLQLYYWTICSILYYHVGSMYLDHGVPWHSRICICHSENYYVRPIVAFCWCTNT